MPFAPYKIMLQRSAEL